MVTIRGDGGADYFRSLITVTQKWANFSFTLESKKLSLQKKISCRVEGMFTMHVVIGMYIVNIPFPIMAEHVFDDDDGRYKWDNSTMIVPDMYDYKFSIFLTVMAFIGGLVLGLIVYWLYLYMFKKYITTHSEDDPSMSDGDINLYLIGYNCGPIDDPPPNYASVMAGESVGGTSHLDRGVFGFVKRIFGRFSDASEDGTIDEEAPPSYSSVIENLERDLSNRQH
ncbi:uncharacterized protein TNCV_4341451 [Trichonephila clavipes]|nr:uncharacterized protein TNCV_4341451 [Trichonephila clavipes]